MGSVDIIKNIIDGAPFVKPQRNILSSTRAMMDLCLHSVKRPMWARFSANGDMLEMVKDDAEPMALGTPFCEGWITTATPVDGDDVLGRIVIGHNKHSLTIGWSIKGFWCFIYPDKIPSARCWGDWEETDSYPISNEKWIQRAKNIALLGGIDEKDIITEDHVKVNLL